MANDKPHPGKPDEPGKPDDTPKGPPIHTDTPPDGDPGPHH
jgi:hypothetical protein